MNSKAVENTQRPSTPSEREIASLYVDGIVYALASGTVCFGGVFELDSTADVVLPALALAGASSYGVYRLNQNGYLSRGMPRTISSRLKNRLYRKHLISLVCRLPVSEHQSKSSVSRRVGRHHIGRRNRRSLGA